MSDELSNSEIPVPEELRGSVAITTLDKIYNWGRRSSVWPIYGWKSGLLTER